MNKCKKCNHGIVEQRAGALVCNYCGSMRRCGNVINYKDLDPCTLFVFDTAAGTMENPLTVWVKGDDGCGIASMENHCWSKCGPLAGCVPVEASLVPHATREQIEYLVDLGYDGPTALSKSEASRLIELFKSKQLPKNAVGWCHYCGQPAYTFDFFDVPACRDCGGE